MAPVATSTASATASGRPTSPLPKRAKATAERTAVRSTKSADKVAFSTFDVTSQVFYRSSCGRVAGIVNLKPIVPGHVLLIPTTHYHRLKDVPADVLGPLFQSVQQVSKGLEEVFGADAVTVNIQDGAAAGQTVDHLHIHVLPRKTGDFTENDEVYDHLEAWGFDKDAAGKPASERGVDAELARKARTSQQMQDEANHLATFFHDGLYVGAATAASPLSPPASNASTRTSKLPVTLLSGFLGAGKTTLLTHILTSPSHNLRIGVIVNDMSSLNIDGSLIASRHSITQSEERMVQMQNGCICCTLRGDLLEEVARIAERGDIDYLVIESTGISEPMQVAETFSAEFAEQFPSSTDAAGGEGMTAAASEEVTQAIQKAAAESGEEISANLASILAAGGLSSVSRLDTCVTVVDALNFLDNFNTADFLTDRHGRETVPEEDDRNVSDLQADQIEFANVILVNKTDLVPRSQVEEITALCKILNPEARIVPTAHSRVDLSQILNTQLFDYEKAAMGAGWLKSLQEEIKPETEEYGIGSFVYRARRPFHPERLWKMIREVFVVIQNEYIDDGVDGEEDGAAAGEEAMDVDDDDGQDSSDGGDDDDDDETASNKSLDSEDDEDSQPQLNPAARLAAKKANATFAPLLRSKGFIWLASRPLMFGEWSGAGVMLTLSGGGRWRCEVPESEWPDDEATRALIRADFDGEWGDRRQEIVLIGQQMREGGQERLTAAFDACLLDDKEWARWQQIMKSTGKRRRTMELKTIALENEFIDGFEDWIDEEDPDAHAGHTH